MTTDTKTAAERVREIRAQLDAIAPLPEQGRPVTAIALARHLAVRAQERFTMMLHPLVPVDPTQVAAMYAAAHALLALAGSRHAGPELDLGIPAAVPRAFRDCHPDLAAAQIRDAWEDGGGIGEWLWDILGEKTVNAVYALVEEMAVAPAALLGEEGTDE
jgi:alkanesulfonate monooxygenase SsuD/methylene tetrahydromethanopterin reductase-like flavin-dependent oxidoreductase (luciferase family)